MLRRKYEKIMKIVFQIRRLFQRRQIRRTLQYNRSTFSNDL